MHLQVRFFPKASPPDVEKVLDRLAKAGVNLVGIGGSDVEVGGELAVVPEHGHEDKAMRALAPYHPRTIDSDDPESGLTLCIVDHQPGALHRCLRDVARRNLARGWVIRDILIGVPDDAQREARQVPVQIYCEAVRTTMTVDGSDGGDAAV